MTLTYLDAIERTYVRLPSGSLGRLVFVGQTGRAKAVDLSSGNYWSGDVRQLERVSP